MGHLSRRDEREAWKRAPIRMSHMAVDGKILAKTDRGSDQEIKSLDPRVGKRPQLSVFSSLPIHTIGKSFIKGLE